MDAAHAAVRTDYPAAVHIPEIDPIFSSSTVFHDAASHTVIVVGPNNHTDGTVEGVVETFAAHQIIDEETFTECFATSYPPYWSAHGPVASAAAAALERIYSAAVQARGFSGRGPTERPNLDVELALGQAIEHAENRLELLKAMRVRFYRRLVSEAESPKAGQKVLEDLHVRADQWQDMQVEDFRRFWPGTEDRPSTAS